MMNKTYQNRKSPLIMKSCIYYNNTLLMQILLLSHHAMTNMFKGNIFKLNYMLVEIKIYRCGIKEITIYRLMQNFRKTRNYFQKRSAGNASSHL